jgi:hypothetical protein
MLMFARMIAVSPAPYAVPVRSSVSDASKAISLPDGSETRVGVNVVVGVEESMDVRVSVAEGVGVGTSVAVGSGSAAVQPATINGKSKVIIRSFID